MENSKMLPDIRIRKITMTDFRNIEHSEVDIPNGKISDLAEGNPSVLGLYGQNGSGKTSLLLAISLLEHALTGQEILYPEFASCIRADSSKCRLEYEFSALNKKGASFDIFYSFTLAKEDNDDEAEPSEDVSAAVDMIFSSKAKEMIMDTLYPKGVKLVIKDEMLQWSGESENKKTSKQVMIDTSSKACEKTKNAFGNKTKYEMFTTNSPEDIHEKFLKWKTEASIKSTSFVFSRKVIKHLIQGTSSMDAKCILTALSEFGHNYLFIIGTDVTAYNNMHLLVLYIWETGDDGAAGCVVPLQLGEHCKVPEVLFDLCKLAIDSINNVLTTIVPGLSIEVGDIGKTLDEEGKELHLFDLISNRNGTRIPFAYESDGIRRIVSFLSLMIAVYNNPSVTVAIDEIDSGIFEYMLGEILSVIGESGKGQLIFTSHNLRPLEVLPQKYLLFTTVNPKNRFAKLEGISGNNNLRDCYFRAIDLGTGKDALYDSTDTFNIEQAMFEAGHQEDL